MAQELYNGYSSCSEGTGNRTNDSGLSSIHLIVGLVAPLLDDVVTNVQKLPGKVIKFPGGKHSVSANPWIAAAVVFVSTLFEPIILDEGDLSQQEIDYWKNRKAAEEKAMELGRQILLNDDNPNNDKDDPTLIYRYGRYTNTNLTPRSIDSDSGLSFATRPPADLSKPFMVTTVEAINHTGTLKAINDHPGHYAVTPVEFPADRASMDDWVASREDAEKNPHPFTTTLKSIVIPILGLTK